MSSITGSPLVARRRMGSFSGPIGEQAGTGGRDEGYSPGMCTVHSYCITKHEGTVPTLHEIQPNMVCRIKSGNEY